MSDFLAYPAWRYHPDKPAVIVQTAADDEALGKGWVDSPLKFPGAFKPAKPPADAEEPADVAGLELPDDESDPKPTRARKK